jgi:hypothetical protein
MRVRLLEAFGVGTLRRVGVCLLVAVAAQLGGAASDVLKHAARGSKC